VRAGAQPLQAERAPASEVAADFDFAEAAGGDFAFHRHAGNDGDTEAGHDRLFDGFRAVKDPRGRDLHTGAGEDLIHQRAGAGAGFAHDPGKRGELAEGRGAASGEAAGAVGCDDNKLVPGEGVGFEVAFELAGALDQTQVELVGDQGRLNRVGVLDHGGDCDAGMQRLKARQHFGQQIHADGHAGAEAQTSAAQVAELGERGFSFLFEGEQAAGVISQQLAGGRGADAARQALEQGGAERELEFPNLLRDRGLADA